MSTTRNQKIVYSTRRKDFKTQKDVANLQNSPSSPIILIRAPSHLPLCHTRVYPRVVFAKTLQIIPNIFSGCRLKIPLQIICLLNQGVLMIIKMIGDLKILSTQSFAEGNNCEIF